MKISNKKKKNLKNVNNIYLFNMIKIAIFSFNNNHNNLMIINLMKL